MLKDAPQEDGGEGTLVCETCKLSNSLTLFPNQKTTTKHNRSLGSAHKGPQAAVLELKALVKALHRRGIEVRPLSECFSGRCRATPHLAV
ncbi:hypothetical protein CYMTET_51595 [Cymbomonas tetramitiformis]|uniref:Uncharacterized protein n=1 Tax=Cymbomonas tetramitiformis TaxID=36881 RepID=A0AAE0ERN5_9CHLO|nr:hypothetical protein CYMTET_51595 [Cymbomonas tetramitiformis]